jgi:hydroxypyruvate reductase
VGWPQIGAKFIRMDRRSARELLLHCFAAGVAAVDPERAVAAGLVPRPVEGRLVVFAMGKAAPAMTRGAAQALGVQRLEGIAVGNHQEPVPPGIELIMSSHPIPDDRSVGAGTALLALAESLTARDHALVLISGGGSALVEVPVAPLTIEDLAVANDVLLRSGADIGQFNMIRRRLSELKGGGLARAIAPATMETLVISDVIGDDPATIASGPTVAVADAPGGALQAVADLGVETLMPSRVLVALGSPLPARALPATGSFRIVANGAVAAHAAAAAAEERGYPAVVVDTRLGGEASEVAGEVLARSPASMSIFAGETTVTVRGNGIGGRNHEAALAVATLLSGRSDMFFLAAGTDGIDGGCDAAGAFVDATTQHRARALGLDAGEMLERNDSGTFFAELGDQLVTGPTGTNVGDLWMVLRAP